MNKITVGFAMCGSFCTFSKAINQMRNLIDSGFDVVPIMSENAANTDTRFGKASDFKNEIEQICGKKIICSIVEAEPIGPKKMTDIMLLAPCTGNTLGKLCNAVTDTPVTMAAKSQLRIQRPVVIALSTNDALGASAENFGKAMNTKHLFFVPIKQDDPIKKPNSLVADFDLIIPTIEAALENKQLQPVFV